LANAGTAGLVIRAVMNQPAHLRGTAIFLNAPENTITMNDMISLKSGVWGRFVTSNQAIPPREQGILVAHIDRLLMGYRCRAWDAASKTAHTSGIMFAGLGGADKLCELANRMLDIVADFDAKSLEPVWEVIDYERKAESA
jgi:hypothetical protein